MNTASNKEKAAKLHLEPFVPIIDKLMKYYKIIFTYLLLLTWSVIGSSTGLSEPDEKSLNTKASQLAIDKADSIGQNMLVVPGWDNLTGSLEIKTGADLPLQKHAILPGSIHRYDYKSINRHKSFVLYVDSTAYFAENGFGRPLQTIQHPSGEYYKGTTYLAYQGPKEDPYVCAYNHRTKVWSGPVKAWTSALGKTPNPKYPDKIDNHGRPALIVDGKGYIHLIFGGHGGESDQGNNSLGSYGSGRQTHLVSKKPGDISSWEILDNIPPFGTYSQFIKMSNNHIYLFYRHGPHQSDWVYQKSIDNGRTFASPVSILKHKPQKENPKIYDTWYAWFQEGPDNTVTSSFNYHPCSYSLEHTSLRVNEYAMKMNTVDDTWENAKGEKLTMPLTKESADSLTMVFDSKGEKTRLGTNLADSHGNPHLYFRYNSKSPAIFYSGWTGKGWQTSTINPPEYTFNDGDLIFENEDRTRFFASYSLMDHNEVGWWNSKDHGLTWEKEAPMLSSTEATYEMSALIRNAHPDARVIVAETPVNPEGKYSKLYLLGNSGPVKRNKLHLDKSGASQKGGH